MSGDWWLDPHRFGLEHLRSVHPTAAARVDRGIARLVGGPRIPAARTLWAWRRELSKAASA